MAALRQRRLALASLLAGAACIGLAPLWVRLSGIGPVATGFHRMALSWPVLVAWMWWDARRHPAEARPSTRAERGWMLAAGLFFAADLWSWHLSIRHTSVANSSLLLDFAPVVVALGSRWLFGERVGSPFWVGLAIAMAGAVVLVGPDLRWGSEHTLGDAQGALTAVFFGAYQVCVKRLRRSRPVPVVMAGSGLAAALPLLAIAWSRGEVLWPRDPHGWGVVVALALTAQVAGQSLIAYGFAHLPAGYSSLTLLVQPVVATLAGKWCLGESPGPHSLAGALLVMGGVAWAAARQARLDLPLHRP